MSHQIVNCALQTIMLKTAALGVKVCTNARCGPRTLPSASAYLETWLPFGVSDSHRARLQEFKRSEIRTDFLKKNDLFRKEEQQESRRRITIDNAEFAVQSAESLGGCVP